jgi:methionine--tRNA ligase beta chain
MDFGVGQIVQAWPHPESDKLWCEKVAFGEGQEVREIASGLRAHFTLEQMTGQRVIVVRNLKSRKLAGFASNGMVLCATGEDGKVEFIEPPPGAALGERVTFEGHPGAAAEPNRVDKKRVGGCFLRAPAPPSTFLLLLLPAPHARTNTHTPQFFPRLFFALLGAQLFDAVAPGLKLVAGVATWEGIPFNTTAGPCKAVTLQTGPVK